MWSKKFNHKIDHSEWYLVDFEDQRSLHKIASHLSLIRKGGKKARATIRRLLELDKPNHQSPFVSEKISWKLKENQNGSILIIKTNKAKWIYHFEPMKNYPLPKIKSVSIKGIYDKNNPEFLIYTENHSSENISDQVNDLEHHRDYPDSTANALWDKVLTQIGKELNNNETHSLRILVTNNISGTEERLKKRFSKESIVAGLIEIYRFPQKPYQRHYAYNLLGTFQLSTKNPLSETLEKELLSLEYLFIQEKIRHLQQRIEEENSLYHSVSLAPLRKGPTPYLAYNYGIKFDKNTTASTVIKALTNNHGKITTRSELSKLMRQEVVKTLKGMNPIRGGQALSSARKKLIKKAIKRVQEAKPKEMKEIYSNVIHKLRKSGRIDEILSAINGSYLFYHPSSVINLSEVIPKNQVFNRFDQSEKEKFQVLLKFPNEKYWVAYIQNGSIERMQRYKKDRYDPFLIPDKPLKSQRLNKRKYGQIHLIHLLQKLGLQENLSQYENPYFQEEKKAWNQMHGENNSQEPKILSVDNIEPYLNSPNGILIIPDIHNMIPPIREFHRIGLKQETDWIGFEGPENWQKQVEDLSTREKLPETFQERKKLYPNISKTAKADYRQWFIKGSISKDSRNWNPAERLPPFIGENEKRFYEKKYNPISILAPFRNKEKSIHFLDVSKQYWKSWTLSNVTDKLRFATRNLVTAKNVPSKGRGVILIGALHNLVPRKATVPAFIKKFYPNRNVFILSYHQETKSFE